MRGYLYDVETQEVYLNNNRYSTHQNHCVIIRKREDLEARFGLRGLIDVFTKFVDLHKREDCLEDSWTGRDIADKLWQLFKEITDDQIRDERRTKREAYREVSREGRADRPNHTIPRRIRKPRTYHISFEKISQELRPCYRSKLPTQARAIIDKLRQQPLETFTEDQLKAFILEMVEKGELVTRQDPWRIFRYYERLLDSYGLVMRRIR